MIEYKFKELLSREAINGGDMMELLRQICNSIGFEEKEDIKPKGGKKE